VVEIFYGSWFSIEKNTGRSSLQKNRSSLRTHSWSIVANLPADISLLFVEVALWDRILCCTWRDPNPRRDANTGVKCQSYLVSFMIMTSVFSCTSACMLYRRAAKFKPIAFIFYVLPTTTFASHWGILNKYFTYHVFCPSFQSKAV
jgi:hypothetical protein